MKYECMTPIPYHDKKGAEEFADKIANAMVENLNKKVSDLEPETTDK